MTINVTFIHCASLVSLHRKIIYFLSISERKNSSVAFHTVLAMMILIEVGFCSRCISH